MTKEELKEEAEESAKKFFGKPTDLVDLDNLRIFKNGYLAGVESREKRIEELIALINAERERQEKCDDVHLRTIATLEKENAELKDGIALKDEEIGCIETEFNTFKSEAKEIITELLKYTDTEAVEMINEAEHFLKE